MAILKCQICEKEKEVQQSKINAGMKYLAIEDRINHSKIHRLIEVEMAQLRKENQYLKSLILTYLPNGYDILNIREKI